MSTTTNTYKLLEHEGYTYCLAEYNMRHSFNKKDLFGFIDIVAIHPNKSGVLAIQVTDNTNVSKRFNKICSIPASIVWLQAGNKIEIQGWCKKDETGWNTLGRRIEVKLDDFGKLIWENLSKSRFTYYHKEILWENI